MGLCDVAWLLLLLNYFHWFFFKFQSILFLQSSYKNHIVIKYWYIRLLRCLEMHWQTVIVFSIIRLFPISTCYDHFLVSPENFRENKITSDFTLSTLPAFTLRNISIMWIMNIGMKSYFPGMRCLTTKVTGNTLKNALNVQFKKRPHIIRISSYSRMVHGNDGQLEQVEDVCLSRHFFFQFALWPWAG